MTDFLRADITATYFPANPTCLVVGKAVSRLVKHPMPHDLPTSGMAGFEWQENK